MPVTEIDLTPPVKARKKYAKTKCQDGFIRPSKIPSSGLTFGDKIKCIVHFRHTPWREEYVHDGYINYQLKPVARYGGEDLKCRVLYLKKAEESPVKSA